MPANENVKMALDLTALVRTDGSACFAGVSADTVAGPPGVILAGFPLNDLPAGFVAECLSILSKAFDDRRWNQKMVSDAVLTHSTCRWIVTARAIDNSQLVGVTTLHSLPEPTKVKLHWVAVDKDWRGRGIGRAMVLMACQKAIDLGARTMVLQTESYRLPAISLYESLGFQPIAPIDRFAISTPHPPRPV